MTPADSASLPIEQAPPRPEGTSGQRLELTWPGKDQFLLVPKDETGKPVWVDRDHPAASEVRLAEFTGTVGEVNLGDPHADNLLFTGDGLDVLRILNEVPEFRREYRGKVTLVYIDPPFNTGQAFDHYDDWMDHSTWLSFMRDRLVLIKEVLATSGSVWVHLDDAEVHRMRALMDEIFGAGNFVGTVIWKRRNDPRNTAPHVSLDHDYVLVYAKDLKSCSISCLGRRPWTPLTRTQTVTSADHGGAATLPRATITAKGSTQC